MSSKRQMMCKLLSKIGKMSELHYKFIDMVTYLDEMQFKRNKIKGKKYIETMALDEVFKTSSEQTFRQWFKELCFSVVDNYKQDLKELSLEYLKEITKFFKSSSHVFQDNAVELEYFASCFINTELMECIWRIVSEGDEIMIEQVLFFIGTISYCSDGLAQILMQRDFVTAISQLLARGRLINDSIDYAGVCLCNLLINCSQDSPCYGTIDKSIDGIIEAFETRQSGSRTLSKICWAMCLGNVDVRVFPKVIGIFCNVLCEESLANIVYSLPIMLTKEPKMAYILVRSNLIYQLLEQYMETVTQAMISEPVLKTVTLIYSSLENKAMQQSVIKAVPSRLLEDATASPAVMEFFAVTHEITFPILFSYHGVINIVSEVAEVLSSGTKAEKLAGLKLSYVLARTNKTARIELSKHEELVHIATDILELYEPEMTSNCLWLLWELLNGSQDFVYLLVSCDDLITTLRSLSLEDTNDESQLCRKILMKLRMDI